jgi:hypothetical protein
VSAADDDLVQFVGAAYDELVASGDWTRPIEEIAYTKAFEAIYARTAGHCFPRTEREVYLALMKARGEGPKLRLVGD